MKKKELRKLYKQKRSELTADQNAAFSQQIADRFYNEMKWVGKNVHVFIPIIEQKEIDTWKIINRLFQERNVNVVTSVCNFGDNTLNHFLINQETRFENNRINVPEPINAKPFDVKDIDLVIVPLLAYDLKGMRVGYGKGFYDRFLGECKSTIAKVGISYFEPIEKIKDLNTYDQALNFCLTPHQTFSF